MVRFILVLSALFTCTVVAHADNVITPGKVELYATYAAVGIEAAYADDDNGNATASFTWRKAGEQAWRNGVDMTVDRKRKLIWASIWPLEPGEVVEVAIEYQDPDLEKKKPLGFRGTATTRSFRFAPAGRTLYVSPKGNDANAGTKEQPFQTFAHAAKQLKPGDTLLAMTGIYKEGNLFQGLKGTAEKPIVIAAAPGETPVLDSSIYLKAPSQWMQNSPHVFSVAVESEVTYVAQDGKRSFPYRTFEELNDDKLNVKRAWCYDAKKKRLYVRTGTSEPAEKHEYHLSQHPYAVHLTKAQHVVLRGLTMRHYGAAAVRLSEGATGCVLYENTIHNSPGAIFMKSETTRDNAIWKSHIYEVGAADFGWNAHYAIEYANQAIYCDKAGRGNSFCHNRIHGYFDLISVESWKNPDKLQYNRDCDIMHNTLYNASDDAIEADGGGVNLRIHGNHIRNCHTALSLAPIERGPVYVTRNHATFLALFIKFNVGGVTSLGWTYIYHNAGYCLLTGADGGTGISYPPNIPVANKVLKNNVVMVNEWCVRALQKGNTLDYNCYYHIPERAPRRFQADKKTYNTIADFAKATGQETHGLYADPLFVAQEGAGKYASLPLSASLSQYVLLKDEKSGDLRLRAGSPCIDRGVVVRGINEDFKGKAPDIGAFERDLSAK